VFTYTFDFTIDRNRIRFELGDTISTNALYQDEEIAAALTASDDSWQAAVIMLIDGVIARLSRTPKTKADWLEVDVTSMLKAYIALRDRKVDEYGLTNDGELLSGSVNVYRTDSEQTEEPTYESDSEDWF
jgi:hypothetical protein